MFLVDERVRQRVYAIDDPPKRWAAIGAADQKVYKSLERIDQLLQVDYTKRPTATEWLAGVRAQANELDTVHKINPRDLLQEDPLDISSHEEQEVRQKSQEEQEFLLRRTLSSAKQKRDMLELLSQEDTSQENPMGMQDDSQLFSQLSISHKQGMLDASSLSQLNPMEE